MFTSFLIPFPNQDNLKELLNLIGLMSALVLSVAGGSVGMFSYDDLVQADARCKTSETELLAYVNGMRETKLSQRYSISSALAVTYLMVSLVLVVLLYTSLVTLDVGKSGIVGERTMRVPSPCAWISG